MQNLVEVCKCRSLKRNVADARQVVMNLADKREVEN